jgi:hypothetical protein
MADYIHTQSGARVSVADGKELGVGFEPVDAPRSKPADKK